jgi:hypothetical protein
MNFLNAAVEKKKRLKVELTIAQKWEIIEYSKKFPKACWWPQCYRRNEKRAHSHYFKIF